MAVDQQSVFQRNLNILLNEYKDSHCDENGRPATREEFAQHIGATLGALKGWLRGGGEPSASMLAQIAEVSNVSVDWLVGKSSERNHAALLVSQAGLMSKIASADSETLAQLEQFYDYLEYQKKRGQNPAVENK